MTTIICKVDYCMFTKYDFVDIIKFTMLHALLLSQLMMFTKSHFVKHMYYLLQIMMVATLNLLKHQDHVQKL